MLLSTSARRAAGLTDDELAEIIERGRAQLAAPVIEASVVEDGSTGERHTPLRVVVPKKTP